MEFNDLIKHLEEKSEIPQEELSVGLKLLSLFQLPDTIDKDKGYLNIDYFPWKYNRNGGFLRKPIVVLKENDKELYTWGLRSVIDSREFFFQILLEARLKGGGPEIEKLLGFIREKNGKHFRTKVFNWVKDNTELSVIEYEVKIGDKHLLAESNLGDIDVLAYDEKTGIIFSIECKQTGTARNMHDMKQDIDQYMGRDGKIGLIHKHIKRHEWLISNQQKVKEFLSLNGDISISSIIVTSSLIPVQYLATPGLPILSFNEIARSGLPI
jgi:hypothetical protein